MTSTRNTPEGRPRLTARSVLASTLLGLDPPELRKRLALGLRAATGRW